MTERLTVDRGQLRGRIFPAVLLMGRIVAAGVAARAIRF
jgi:hypothetical protein